MLTAFDTSIIQGVSFKIFSSGGPYEGEQAIEFQFPPRMPSDSRTMSWHEGNQQDGEPFAYYITTDSRKMTLEWTYIVGARGGYDNSIWTSKRIKKQVNLLKGYFVQGKAGTAAGMDHLIVKFKMWLHGTNQEMTCRMLSADIKHGETLIGYPKSLTKLENVEDSAIGNSGSPYGDDNQSYEDSSGNPGDYGQNPEVQTFTESSLVDFTYPLRTDVRIDFRLWWNVEAKYHVNGLLGSVPNGWY